MQLLIRIALLVILVLLVGRLLNHLFPAKPGSPPREEDEPIIDGVFTDITDETDDYKA